MNKTIEYVVGWHTKGTDNQTKSYVRWYKDRRSALSKYISVGLKDNVTYRHIHKRILYENGSVSYEEI